MLLDNRPKYAGTQYTTTVAMLVVAFIFSPAVLLLSRPSGYGASLAASACSAVCVALAWLAWKKHSELTIPSIAPARLRSN